VGDGYQLLDVRGGIRITKRVEAAGMVCHAVSDNVVVAVVTLLLGLLALLAYCDGNWASPQLLHHEGRLRFALPCVVAAVALWRFVWPSTGVGGAPLVCATARTDITNEELRDILADPALFGEWRPGHLEGRLLSLGPTKDEVLYTRFRLGFLGLTARFRARRRWLRGTGGVRLLCSVAEVRGEGGGISGFEGFAVLPGDDSGCTVAWLCGLDLAPWAPRQVQERLAVERVSALAGLREWLACPACPVLRPGPGGSRTRACLADSLPHSASSQSLALLRGFRRAAAGGLHLPSDLERAATTSQLLWGLWQGALTGSQDLAVSAAPHGLLLQAGADLAQRYAMRWAYASQFLPAAGNAETARERLLLVVAFVVAGLHLAAASYTHLPWVIWAPGAARHTAMLPDETRVRIDVDVAASEGPADKAPALVTRQSTFEVHSRAGSGFRIYGTDSVSCHAELPRALRFEDRGTSVVEFSPGGGAVRFQLPELRVRAGCWSLGSGSVYEWTGSAHFVDETGGVQCDLCFGHSLGGDGESADAVAGTVRDALGFETGHLRGSWLGPLFCDGEVLWRGPRQQPAPY